MRETMSAERKMQKNEKKGEWGCGKKSKGDLERKRTERVEDSEWIRCIFLLLPVQH
jgi:hypothetical protein